MRHRNRPSAMALLILALGAAGGATGALAQAAAPNVPRPAAEPAHAAGTLLTVSAEGRVEAVPDIVRLGAGVRTQAADAATALAQNRQAMDQVVRALRAGGLADRDIRSQRVSLQPQYRYEQNQPPILVGYVADNRVMATVRDIAAAGRLVDRLVAAGANQIFGPDFDLSRRDALMDEARADAVARARRRAEIYARAAGLSVVRIVEMSEVGLRAPQPMVVAASRMAAEALPDTPIEPGEQEVSVRLTVVFELR